MSLHETAIGILLVLVAGLGTGSIVWPMKVAKTFKFEHCWFVGMLTGLVIVPWAVTLLCCPHPLQAGAAVGGRIILVANLYSLAWGVANVIYGVCVMRIGAALTGAILSGFGVAVGVTMPLIVKGTGLFQNAPDLNSPAGYATLAGVVVIVVGVVLVSLAGFGRDRALQATGRTGGGFLLGLILSVIAGVTSAGISLSFVYSQGPIVAAMKQHGATDLAAAFAVWAFAISGGALVNVIYPAWLMTKGKSWGVLRGNSKELGLAALIGLQFMVAITLLWRGMVLLGALGASVGFGIQQSMQILGNQLVGFASGEWKGVVGSPRRQMIAAIVVLVGAAMILAYANTLTGKQ